MPRSGDHVQYQSEKIKSIRLAAGCPLPVEYPHVSAGKPALHAAVYVSCNLTARPRFFPEAGTATARQWDICGR